MEKFAHFAAVEAGDDDARRLQHAGDLAHDLRADQARAAQDKDAAVAVHRAPFKSQQTTDFTDDTD